MFLNEMNFPKFLRMFFCPKQFLAVINIFGDEKMFWARATGIWWETGRKINKGFSKSLRSIKCFCKGRHKRICWRIWKNERRISTVAEKIFAIELPAANSRIHSWRLFGQTSGAGSREKRGGGYGPWMVSGCRKLVGNRRWGEIGPVGPSYKRNFKNNKNVIVLFGGGGCRTKLQLL